MGKKSRNKSSERKEYKKKKSKKSRQKNKRSSKDSSGAAELQRQREAVHIFRLLLSEYPTAKKELREMIWKLDDGEAVATSGVADPVLRQLMEDMFCNLGLKQLSKGYCRSSKADKVISVLAPVFELPPLPSGSAAKYLATKQSTQAGAGKRSSPAASASSSGPDSSGDDSDTPPAKRHSPDRDVKPNTLSPSTAKPIPPVVSNTPFKSGSHPERHNPVKLENVEGMDEGAAEEWAQGGVGPADPMKVETGEGINGQEAAKLEEVEGVGEGGVETAVPSVPRKRLGPVMPSAEDLAAAQEAAAEYEATGKVWRPGGGAEEEEDDFIIGPIPPEMELELGDVPQDERSQEVSRIMSVGRGTNAKAEDLDAYDVLGVAADAPVGDVKKRYWKLSLLIHPDKCSHPQADEAFKRLSLAAKILQNASSRSDLDNKRMAAEVQKWEQEAAEQEERERQWRVVRGEEVDTGPVRKGPTEREEWMLTLPEERRAPAVMSQVSVRSFGRNTVSNGDVSGWTKNPLQGAQAGPALLTGTGAYASTAMLMGKEEQEPSVPAGQPGGVILTSGTKRSLLEKHQDDIKTKKKKKDKDKRDDKNSKSKSNDAEWVGQHPWRPFDREKDLGPSLGKAKDAKSLLKGAAQLSSRFASGGASRM